MTFSVDQIPVVRMEDKLGFQYIEKTVIYVKDNALVLGRKDGRKDRLCTAGLACLLLGAGTSISRDAIKLVSDQNCGILWCGKRGMSMYTVGLNTNSSMKNAKTQIERITNNRFSLWRKLFFKREISYKDTDNVKELLLIEATHMKRKYEEMSNRYGLKWNGRVPQVSKMDPSDTLNYAITICNMALYGVATACICGMGYLPQFGIIHGSGATPLSYDLADTVKTYTTIPIAMEYVSSHSEVDINELLSILSAKLNEVNVTKTFTETLVMLFQKNL